MLIFLAILAIAAAIALGVTIKLQLQSEFRRGFHAGYKKASYDAALIQTQINNN